MGPLATHFDEILIPPPQKKTKKNKQKPNLFIHDNASENIVCEMAAILSRGHELNELHRLRVEHEDNGLSNSRQGYVPHW